MFAAAKVSQGVFHGGTDITLLAGNNMDGFAENIHGVGLREFNSDRSFDVKSKFTVWNRFPSLERFSDLVP
jgi:hypothetical protein